VRFRQRDADRSFGKPRNGTTSSTTYALAPVYCSDSQLTSTTNTETSGLTVLSHSPSKARTLPPARAGSPPPSPRTTYRRGMQIGYSPATVARHKFVVDGGTMTPRFDDLDVWRISASDDLSVLPSHHHCVWSAETDLPLPALPTTTATTTWQRCGCLAGAAPACTASSEHVPRATPPPRSTMMTMTSPKRVHGATPPPSSTTLQATTPMSFQTFKPSSGVELTTCPAITLRPERCGDAEQTRQTCHALNQHCSTADSALRSQQPIT